MESGSETFISHLVELRDRLLRAIIAVVVLTLVMIPGAKEIYAVLAQPLLAALPAGATLKLAKAAVIPLASEP